MTEPVTGVLRWLPWAGGIVVLGIVGSLLGVTGVFGHPIQKVTVAVNSILMPPTVQATSCPDGPVVASVERGSRVIALARNIDGTQVQVRNPENTSQLVWVHTSQVDADTGESAVPTLPIGAACPTLFVAQTPVVVTPVAPVTPVKPSKPGAPADTTKPTVGKPSFGPLTNCSVTVTTTASDNVGVTSVTISWTGGNAGGPKAMTPSGSGWTYTFASNSMVGSPTTFAVTAHDAAGKSSPVNSATDTNMQCLI